MPETGWMARLRRAQVPLARAVVVLFAATWLGLAVQPCVASATTHHDSATTHGEGHAGGCGGAEPAPEPQAHDCPHCAHKGDCGTALECDAIGVPALVTKPAEPALADLGAWIDLPAPVVAVQPGPRRAAAPTARHAPRAPPRTLQQRFCRYQK